MKLMLSLLFLAMTANAFAAGLDDFLGKYRAKDGDGMALITKRLVKERTLFEPDEYVYQLEVERRKDDIERSLDLEIGVDKKSLVGSDRDDCDNPDCHAFNTFDVTVQKKAGKIQLKIEYDGYDTVDGEDEATEFYGEALFLKIK